MHTTSTLNISLLYVVELALEETPSQAGSSKVNTMATESGSDNLNLNANDWPANTVFKLRRVTSS